MMANNGFFLFLQWRLHHDLYRFIVKKGTPGYRATKIENKIGLRMVQNGDITMDDVFIPEEDRIPGINSFKDTNKVLGFFHRYEKLHVWW